MNDSWRNFNTYSPTADSELHAVVDISLDLGRDYSRFTRKVATARQADNALDNAHTIQ
jgi:hypothetical protein